MLARIMLPTLTFVALAAAAMGMLNSLQHFFIPAFAPATPTEVYLRRLDPDLRRFIASYARRRPELPLPLRAQLAGQVQGNLYRAAPDVYTQHGPLAALDYLADLERGAGVPVGSAPQ